MELEKFYGHDKKITRFDARLTDLEDKFYAGEGCYPDRIFAINFGDGREDRNVRVYSVSGRSEISGNHTDHNHGKVLVAAISCDILAAVKKRDDGRIKISSDGFAPFELNADDTGAKECERGTSKALTRGVAAAIKGKGFVIGGCGLFKPRRIPRRGRIVIRRIRSFNRRNIQSIISRRGVKRYR